MGDDFDAKSNVAQIAFTKDYTVCLNAISILNKECVLFRVLSSIYQVNLMNKYNVLGKILHELN